MKTLTVGLFKSHFSEIIDKVKMGEEFTVSYGKRKEKVAVLIPYKKHISGSAKRIGILQGKGTITFSKNFKMTDEEFLNS